MTYRLLLLLLTAFSISAIGNESSSVPQSAALRETVVVTGSRTGVPLAELGGSVIEAGEILRPLPYSPLEVVDDVAGVTAFQKGGAGGSSYLSIRGGEPNYTLVLLDGVKLNDPTNSQGGSFDMSQIDPAVLDRIDIYRGALSAVHGADALSGVVNLQLRSFASGELFRSARVVADTESSQGINGALGAGWDDGSFLLSGSWADAGDLTEQSTQSRRQFIGRLSQNFDAVHLDGTLLHGSSDREGFPEDSGGSRLAVNRELETVASELSVVDLDISGADDSAIRPHLKTGWSKQTADAHTPAIFPGVLDYVPPIDADTDFRRLEVSSDVGVDINTMLTTVVGAGYAKETGDSRGFVDFGVLIPAQFDIERSLSSVFAELTARPDERASATLGIRYDDPSEHKNEWTSRLSLHYQPYQKLPALYANWSEGYKLPSLYALAYPLIANPTLKPERSRSVDVGIQHQPGAATSFRLGYFHSRFTDMIDFDENTFTNVNRAWVETSGVEAEARHQFGAALMLSANLTYMETDAIDNRQLRSRPRWQGGAVLGWVPADRMRTFIGAQYRGSNFDSSVPTGLIETDSYVTLESGISVRLAKGWELSLVLKNLLDEDYEETLGTPAPGRLARVAVSCTL